jgi:hypothetical protein
MTEGCTRKEQQSVVHFLWEKGLNAKNIHKGIFSAYGGKNLSRNAVPPWWQTFR